MSQKKSSQLSNDESVSKFGKTKSSFKKTMEKEKNGIVRKNNFLATKAAKPPVILYGKAGIKK